MMMNKYEELATTFAERYGIMEYELKGSRMIYTEKAFDGQNWNTYTHTIQLNSKEKKN